MGIKVVFAWDVAKKKYVCLPDNPKQKGYEVE